MAQGARAEVARAGDGAFAQVSTEGHQEEGGNERYDRGQGNPGGRPAGDRRIRLLAGGSTPLASQGRDLPASRLKCPRQAAYASRWSGRPPKRADSTARTSASKDRRRRSSRA